MRMRPRLRASKRVLVLGALALLLACAVSAPASPIDRTNLAGVLPSGHRGIVRLAQATTGQARGDPRLDALFAKAKAGDPTAQTRLGEKFAHGADVGRDLAEAARWYRLAAEQGHAGAQLNLGELYENGAGVEQDLGEAARWYREAAAGGEVLAQLTLGLWSREGRGVPADYGEAVRWFRAVADRGFAMARSIWPSCISTALASRRTTPRRRRS
jgi:hypothetical protein